MELTQRDLKQLTKLITLARAAYYNSGKFLKVPADKMTPDGSCVFVLLFGAVHILS